MIELEKYRGKKTRHTCPGCNHRNEFTRYVGEDGNYFAETVGKCNRLSCNYHYTPKQFFADNPQLKDEKTFKPRKRMPKVYPQITKTFSTIPDDYLLESVEDYQNNDFAKGLLALFPDEVETVKEILQMYFVGTFDGLTAFWQVDKFGKIRTAKLMRYDAETLKRQSVFEWADKETGELQKVATYWIHKSLEKKEIVKDFQLETVFFGEHLLSRFPDKKLAIVEAEKTAIICAIVFRELMPDYIWLSTGSAGMLQADRLARLGKREILLFPDTNAFDLWTQKADEAHKIGLNLLVSDLLETALTEAEKKEGLDLADFLINEQRENLKKPEIEAQNIAEKNCTVAAHFESGKGQDVREVLNQFGAKGWQVVLSENGSEIDHLAEVLTDSETDWLIHNFDEVRAVLFQSWLVRNVFNQNPDLLEDFRFEVMERLALMSDSGEQSVYLKAVLLVGWQWWLNYQNEAIQWH